MDGSMLPSLVKDRDVPDRIADRLIVALDVETSEQASEMVKRLDGIVSFFKIGMWLFAAEGTEKLIDDLIASNKRVFLDYKMFDIGETVKQGVARARDRGVDFVTVHGDEEIMKAAVEGKDDSSRLKIFSITVLTSLNNERLFEMGYRLTVKDLIELRVRKSLQCGCDGIIASAHDNPDEIRRLVNSPGLLIATPGVRFEGSNVDDHQRIATPKQAMERGADYLVIGRPIIRSDNPSLAAERVIDEMQLGASSRYSNVTVKA